MSESDTIKIGDTIYYDGKPATVTGTEPGAYGQRVIFTRDGATIATDPDLDFRFSYIPPPEEREDGPEIGSLAYTARMMAQLCPVEDDPDFWDRWKDDMKEGRYD